MRKYFDNFLLMLQFMTRIPINLSLPCTKEDFKRGTVFLPVVGGIIGIIEWVIFYCFSKIIPINVAAVLTIASSILLTGALHFDGLGDTCDGFFASKGKDKIIEIMKDSRIGTYACLALLCDILLKISAISNFNSLELSFIIITTPMIARSSMVLLFNIGECAKKNGTGNFFIGNCGKLQVSLSLLLALALSTLLIGIIKASIFLLCSILLVLTLNKYCNKKLGGLTGDTLGAVNEIVEISIFIIGTIFIKL